MKLNKLLNPNKSAIGGKTEKILAPKLNAKLTPASGALDGAKSDLVRKDFRFESKATQNDSMSMKYDWLLKIKHEALTTNRKPALVVSFTNGDAKPRKDGQWVLIPLSDFNELTGE